MKLLLLNHGLLAILLTVVARGDFGPKSPPDASLSLELRGVPGNLASFFFYADAVAVVKRQGFAGTGVIMATVETVWQKGGGEVEPEIFVAADERNYQTNRRSLDLFKEFKQSTFSYPLLRHYSDVPTLVFLRKAVISDELRRTWKLKARPVYKVVNGGEGCAPLQHLAAKPENGGVDRFWKSFGQLHIKEATVTFGSDDSLEIFNTVIAFYKGESKKFDLLDNPVARKLRVDAISLIRQSIDAETAKPTDD